MRSREATDHGIDKKKQVEFLKKELEKYGIYNEEQLDEGLKSMKKINIGCFVTPLPKVNSVHVENGV